LAAAVLASIGYQLSSIEQAVATGTAWEPGATSGQVFTDHGCAEDVHADATDGLEISGASDADATEEKAAA
jgi:hypothetical protein